MSMLENDVRLSSEVRDDVAMVRRNIALEVRLIDDLLDVLCIIAGKLRLENASVDVAQAVREAARIVEGDIKAKQQTLTVELAGSPYLLEGDAARLQQLFWNLLSNASKFTPPGGRIDLRGGSRGWRARCPTEIAMGTTTTW